MPGTGTRLADFMPYRLSVTTNAVSDLIAGEYRNKFGLKIPEWRVMAVLGDTGSLTQRHLVNATLMDKVAVNRACKVLEQRGLVRRSPNADDGRSHHLELTEEGAEMYAQIMPLAIEMEARVFACLSPRETEKLKASLAKLHDSVKQVGSAMEQGAYK